MSEIATGRREERVAAAVKVWADSLIDLGGRNNLLHYRDLAVGTLDLDAADETAMTQLRAGRSVRLSRLFPARDVAAAQLRSARRIRAKMQELDEERGIRAGFLATGMASWFDPQGRRPPQAPVFLRPVRLEPVSGSQEDFSFTFDDEVELNPVLMHVLSAQFGVRPGPSAVAALLELAARSEAQQAFATLHELASGVEDFAIEDREVIGTFTYAKLPMVTDLRANVELLMAHDVVAAIAGDPDAALAVRAQQSSAEPVEVDRVPPSDEYVVLDADASQSRAINAAVAGSHLVIKGPPGTGKSQTIANLISSLIARGQTVLFVAEKRAAIDAVTRRLDLVGLSDHLMDLHDGPGHRRAVAGALASSLERAAQAPAPDRDVVERRLDRARGELNAHAERMHRRREPWSVSIFQAQAAALATPPSLVANCRFVGADLRSLAAPVLAEARARLREYVEHGALDEAWASSPWAGAPITTAEQGERVLSRTMHIATVTLPDVVHQFRALLAQTGLRHPGPLAQWPATFDLLEHVSAALSRLAPAVFLANLPEMCAATGSSDYRKLHGIEMGYATRRRLVQSARACWRGAKLPSKSRLHAALDAAAVASARWAGAARDGGLPRLPTNLAAAKSAYAALSADLEALQAELPDLQAFTLDEALLGRLVADMTADVATLDRLPRVNELARWFGEHRLDPLLDEARARGVDAEQAVVLLEDAWHRSLLADFAASEPDFGAFNGHTHAAVVSDFVDADLDHVAGGALRVASAASRKLTAALEAHEEQARQVRAEAAKRTRHRPMRELWRLAPDVLLAAKPCWALSPLVVSQVLPASRLFDVVVFDEASQVHPADAIPALMRAERAVVAGDERQLPPTDFFAAAVTEDEDPEAVAVEEGTLEPSLTRGFESILDVLSALLPQCALTWHYRSRDERLIAFSNTHIYGSGLVTFPGVLGENCLRHVLVPQAWAVPGQERSVIAEAERVVDLVLEHAQTRPSESLGVIALGIKHAERIQGILLERLAERRDLDEFFAQDRFERFFVKNLERVQGDERDAIILSVGYGKDADGRLRYHWGPINASGGERRLNVAVTRAKRRMTVVSSFAAKDVDAQALHSQGAQLLRAYLEFASRGGGEPGPDDATWPSTTLNGFEGDVRDRLGAAGIPIFARFGVSDFRVDFAAAHPAEPARMVLAVEADGQTYREAGSARDRDRLRREHLENLGWSFHRLWSTDWFRHPEAETERIRVAYERAVARADATPAPASAAPVRDRPARAAPPPKAALARPVARLAREQDGARLGWPDQRPAVRRGQPISQYTPEQLREVVRYITSDGRPRTRDEVANDVMRYLGFNRAGTRVRTAVGAAVAAELGG